MKTITIIGYALIIIISGAIFTTGIKSCSAVKPGKSKPCTQCPQYTEHLQSLTNRIYDDSVTLTTIQSEYQELWNENQIFSSMLSEIENEPGGQAILKKLWEENK